MSDELPFKYVGGDLSLDLVNTIDWTSQGPIQERLDDYGRLTRWAEGAGAVTRQHAALLRKAGAANPSEAEAALAAARQLREVLQRLYLEVASRVSAGSGRKSTTWEDFNGQLAEALLHLRVSPLRKGERKEGDTAEWKWEGRERLDSLLWPVTWAAAFLLTSDEASRIRVCASLDCGWMYVDRSRNGLRRWCQMESCGTMEKTRRRAERARAAGKA